MKVSGYVVQSSPERIAISVKRASCEQCRAAGGCGYSSPSEVQQVFTTDGTLGIPKIGEPVSLWLPEGHLWRATGLAYGLPLALGFLGGIIVQGITNLQGSGGDHWAPIGFLCGVVIGFSALNLVKFEPVRISAEGAALRTAIDSGQVPIITLVSRGYCHLCRVMQNDLETTTDLPQFQLNIVDVDASPTLLERFDELVPVLLTDSGEEICHYHLDRAKVREYLKRFE